MIRGFTVFLAGLFPCFLLLNLLLNGVSNIFLRLTEGHRPSGFFLMHDEALRPPVAMCSVQLD